MRGLDSGNTPGDSFLWQRPESDEIRALELIILVGFIKSILEIVGGLGGREHRPVACDIRDMMSSPQPPTMGVNDVLRSDRDHFRKVIHSIA